MTKRAFNLMHGATLGGRGRADRLREPRARERVGVTMSVGGGMGAVALFEVL